MRSSKVMSSPFASSNFCALITGGSSAPSEGGEKITMVSFSTAWARASAVDAENERRGGERKRRQAG